MNVNSNVGFPRWMTAEGTLDLAELPIDGILKQAIDPEFERFRSAYGLLGCMAGAGRREAGLYLIGLLGLYPSDLQRLEVIAGAAWAFFPRVVREPTLGRDPARQKFEYHSAILGPAVLPLYLVKSGLEGLAEDTSFSPKMRAKFRNCCERTGV